MQYVETTKVKVNRCTCSKSHTYVVNGSEDLYTVNDSHEIILPVIRKYAERPKMLQSILVFCDCGNLTIHYPILSNSGAGWKYRKMWKGWRGLRVELYWDSPIKQPQQTLQNVSRLLLRDSGSIKEGFYFVTVPSDGHNIHPEQRIIAEQVFNSLLACWTNRGFRLNIDYRIRECAWQGMLIANDLINKHLVLEQVLPGIVQEMYNLRHISKSGRLGDVRNALQKLCADISITLPELLQNDTGQPEVIKQFFSAP